MASPLIQFRAVGMLAERLAERTDHPLQDRMLAEVARRDLERYYTLLARALMAVREQFSEAEIELLVDATNDLMVRPETVHLIWAEVADALRDGLAEKWQVDGPALVEKLRGFTPSEMMALADAIERFWTGLYQMTDMQERLRAVGLVAGNASGIE